MHSHLLEILGNESSHQSLCPFAPQQKQGIDRAHDEAEVCGFTFVGISPKPHSIPIVNTIVLAQLFTTNKAFVAIADCYHACQR